MSKHLFHKVILVMIATVQMFLLSGCDVQIFEKKTDPYAIVAYKKEDLENFVYYVKDTTNFYKMYKGDGTTSNIVREPSDKRLLWFMKDRVLVPTYYANEIIAYPSTETSLNNNVIERFADIGWSLGLHSATFGDGGINVDTKSMCVEGSSFAKKMAEMESTSIKIVKINGTPVTSSTINQSGVITGLTQDGVYNVGLYAGSRYKEVDISADVWFLRSYEVFSIERAEMTPNGYLSLEFPSDWKDGYYLVNGESLCRYYSVPKSEANPEADMNVPYYTSDIEQMAVFSQQFIKEIPYLSKDVQFTITYDSASVMDGQEAKAYLTSPGGDRMNFQMGAKDSIQNTSTMVITLNEAGPGKWMINVYPKNISIYDVTMTSSNTASENKQETQKFHFDEDVTNRVFYVEFSGAGNISAIMVNENGETSNFELNKETGRLEYNASYLKAGEYTVYVYHQIDTVLETVDWEEDSKQFETEIIVVEE